MHHNFLTFCDLDAGLEVIPASASSGDFWSPSGLELDQDIWVIAVPVAAGVCAYCGLAATILTGSRWDNVITYIHTVHCQVLVSIKAQNTCQQ